MDLKTLGSEPFETGTSPFFTGGEAVVYNPGEAAVTIESSADGDAEGEWDEVVEVPASGMVKIADLPAFLRVAAGEGEDEAIAHLLA